MKIRLRLILRALLLLAVWAAAGYAAYCGGQRLVEHRKVSSDVTRLSSDYDTTVSNYAGLLVEGKKISSDPNYQVHLLKQRFGYARPNETPIVVQIEGGK